MFDVKQIHKKFDYTLRITNKHWYLNPNFWFCVLDNLKIISQKEPRFSYFMSYAENWWARAHGTRRTRVNFLISRKYFSQISSYESSEVHHKYASNRFYETVCFSDVPLLHHFISLEIVLYTYYWNLYKTRRIWKQFIYVLTSFTKSKCW